MSPRRVSGRHRFPFVARGDRIEKLLYLELACETPGAFLAILIYPPCVPTISGGVPSDLRQCSSTPACRLESRWSRRSRWLRTSLCDCDTPRVDVL